jgi:phage baseplate assembly protein W
MGINKSFSLTFPFIEDTASNTFKTNVTTKDAIRSKLLLLITTDYGSLYYNRDFGTNVKKYLFEPADSLTADNIKSDIITNCNKFITDISINGVEIIIDNDIINLTINFLYKTNNELDSISLTFNR